MGAAQQWLQEALGEVCPQCSAWERGTARSCHARDKGRMLKSLPGSFIPACSGLTANPVQQQSSQPCSVTSDLSGAGSEICCPVESKSKAVSSLQEVNAPRKRGGVTLPVFVILFAVCNPSWHLYYGCGLFVDGNYFECPLFGKTFGCC